MEKNNKSGFVSSWIDAIRNSKRKIEYYYLNTDTERKQPYKVTGVFGYNEVFVKFHPIKTDGFKRFVLEREKFLELFYQVIEEI